MNKKERQLAYERERKAMNDLAMREFDRERAIEAIHKEHIETIQEQIDGFYMRYAGSEGLTRAEAMKRADQMDVTKFANKAKKAVKEKDFSLETNEWLKTYNLKMKVSRLELLKEEVNWELIQMYDKDYQLISESLREEARLELERQAGILGDSVRGARQRIDGIVNSDFYGKNFSERIWSRTGLYQTTQKEVFKSLSQIYATMDGYRNERNRLMDKMQTTEYETMRLLRTENARIGSQMQVEAYKANEFTHFIYVAEPGACDICGPLDGKIFPVSEAQIGLNLKPLHPNCRCSSHGYIAMERLIDGKWIDEATGEEVEQAQPELSIKQTENKKKRQTTWEVENYEPENDVRDFAEKPLDYLVIDDHVTAWQKDVYKNRKVAYKGINNYGGTEYKRYNETLRRGYDSEKLPGFHKTVEEMNKALGAFDNPENIVVYRSLGADAFEDIEKMVGSIYNDKGFMSTGMVGKEPNKDYAVLRITVPKGKGYGADIRSMTNTSQTFSEREFLLKSDTDLFVYKVDCVMQRGKPTYTIHAEVITDG